MCNKSNEMLTLNIVAVAPEVLPVTVAVPEPDVAIQSDISDFLLHHYKTVAVIF